MTKPQQDFFVRLIPLARRVQEWTHMKAQFLGTACPRGVLPSITLAYAISRSDWGAHPIAKPEFFNKYSNNLAVLEAGVNWKGRAHEFEGVRYRAYKDWREFGIDLSDEFTFSRAYDIVLACPKETEQIKAFCTTQPGEYSLAYYKEFKQLIDTYYLSEFNV